MNIRIFILSFFLIKSAFAIEIYDSFSSSVNLIDTVFVVKRDTVFQTRFKTVQLTRRDTLYISSDKIVALDDSDAPLILEGVNFEVGSSVIKEESFEILDKVHFTLEANRTLKITISGFTDNTGKKSSNITLSENRSNAVKVYLISKGIEPARMKTEGFGPEKPIASNSTRKGRAKNRRIEFSKTLLEE